MMIKNFELLGLFKILVSLTNDGFAFEYPALRAIIGNKVKIEKIITEKAEVEKKIQDSFKDEELNREMNQFLQDSTEIDLVAIPVKNLNLRGSGKARENEVPTSTLEALHRVELLDWS
jgi:hypothetical protein